jgi:signal transduction histidine kinase
MGSSGELDVGGGKARGKRMGFLERLRGHLERVRRAPGGIPTIQVDVAAHHRHFAEACDHIYRAWNARFQSMPAEEEWDHDLVRREEQQIRDMRESLPAFLEEVADHITETLVPNASQEEVTKLINIAINWELWGGDDSTTGSRGLDEEMGRIAALARSRLRRRSGRDGWESPARYAFEIRATARKHGDRQILTRSGAAFLELPGIDAVRWLLALEAAQSLGPADEWRASTELAAQLLAEPEREIEVEELVDGSWRFSLATIRRLHAMRLLQYEGQHLEQGKSSFSYAVFDGARPLLEEIAERRATPLAVLADALLRDEVAGIIQRVRPDAAVAAHDSVAAASVLQARMVVHEIRNALVPAQVALAQIEPTEATARHRKRIEGGIRRALAFVHEMLQMTKLGPEPTTLFDVEPAVRDAIAALAGDLNGMLRIVPAEPTPPVVGHRPRFILAIVNLLRNAAQVVDGTDGTVEIAIESRGETVMIRVDDAGPGVASENRGAIFEPGVSQRDGGSGHGLALVREVIETEMGGTVSCEESPLGGARFVIVLPIGKWRPS